MGGGGGGTHEEEDPVMEGRGGEGRYRAMQLALE